MEATVSVESLATTFHNHDSLRMCSAKPSELRAISTFSLTISTLPKSNPVSERTSKYGRRYGLSGCGFTTHSGSVSCSGSGSRPRARISLRLGTQPGDSPMGPHRPLVRAYPEPIGARLQDPLLAGRRQPARR